MADALRKSGRDIAFGICEWGHRQPWKWAAAAGGQVWRIGGDIRDKWRDLNPDRKPPFTGTYGILDAIDDNAPLARYAGPGHWNDMDMLIVGMYGKKGPSSLGNGTGCTDIEYRTQMSMWCMLSSMLAAGNDIRNMNAVTKETLLNREVIALNQDALGKQAEMKIKNENWYVFVKPLSGGDFAVSVLNLGKDLQTCEMNFQDIDLPDKYEIRDIWEHKVIGKAKKWKGQIQSHETRVFRLKKT